jgi:anaerobic magnesium-protoporphyrin IX monomethyl ester cyclase
VLVADVSLFSLRFGRKRGCLPPLGALSLTAALEHNGITCELVDTQRDPAFNPCSIDRLTQHIRRSDAPIVALSLFNDAIPLVVATLEQMQDELRGRRVFLGGPGVVGIAEMLLARLSGVEAIIVGEGETAFPLLINDPATARQLPGVFTRAANGTITGQGRTARENLDQIPSIQWSRITGDGYSVAPWSTMRGCPFDCQFCEIVAFMGRRVTTRSIPAALDDLAATIDALGTSQVDILDDTFTVSKKRVLKVCEGLRQRQLEARFSIFSRTDTLDEETMAALAAAGCERVFFGVDGGDDEVLDRIAKGVTIDAAERTIVAAAEYFQVTASFIWGYPFESRLAFSRMMELAERLRTHGGSYKIWPQLHLLSPSAGTPLFHQFSDSLRFDGDREVLPLGRALSEESFRHEYARILSFVEQEKVLAAPFWHYDTVAFEEKGSEVDRFNAQLDQELGAAIVSALEATGAANADTSICHA